VSGRADSTGDDPDVAAPGAQSAHHDKEIAAVVAAARYTCNAAAGMKP
jgi:hypothetical protein